MSAEITREKAVSPRGEEFEVKVNRFPGMPPVIVCDGPGYKCPFRGIHHSSVPTCKLNVDSIEGLQICGKVTEPD